MDYNEYNKDYSFLIKNYKIISKILADQLIAFRDKGLRLNESYMFGFSYGARLIVRAGSELGQKQLGIIHRSYRIPF